MKKILLSLLMMGATMLSATGNAAEVGKVVYAFEGDLGSTVWTARYGVESTNQALVQIMFVDHELSGKILLASTEETEKEKRYIIQVKDKPYTLLIQRKNALELYLPSTKSSLSLSYNKSLSREGNPQAFLSEYEAQ